MYYIIEYVNIDYLIDKTADKNRYHTTIYAMYYMSLSRFLFNSQRIFIPYIFVQFL